jgi:hypothetical protein
MSKKLTPFKIARNVAAIVAVIIISFVIIGIMPFVFGGKNMKTFCRQITPGMTSNEVHKLTERTHYKLLEHKKGDNHTIKIIDSKAMGRFLCEVALDKDEVIEARYVFND